MTGPEHYRAAEQFLAATQWTWFGGHPGGAEAMALYAQAQVHATLALAAATALAVGDPTPQPYREWDTTAGGRP